MSVNIGIPTKDPSEGKRYDARHEVWETVHQFGSPIYRLRRTLLLELIPEESGALRFLDVGCGTGDYSGVLLRRGHYVDAIDISDAAVREAVKRIPQELRHRFRAQVGDFSVLGEQPGYHGIICSEVLEHVQDDEALLRQLHALLLPQGNLLLSVPADSSLWSEDDVFSGHVRRYTHVDLAAKLERAGFTVEKFWSYGFPMLRIYCWLKLRLFSGKTVQLVAPLERTTRRWVVRFLLRVMNVLVWMLDRNILNTRWGIGFVVRCQKA